MSKERLAKNRTCISRYFRKQTSWTLWLLGLATISLSIQQTIRFMVKPISFKRHCTVPWPTLGETNSKCQMCITTLSDANYNTQFTEASIRDFSHVLDATWDNKVHYAAEHNYKLFNASDLLDLNRPSGWSKILAVQDALNRDCDWVFWMDADSLIMNSHITIEDILPSDERADLIIAEDAVGFNSGMWMVRKSNWTTQFLNEWWSMTDFIRAPGDVRPGDNYALDDYLGRMDDRDEHVFIAPRCSFNSFSWGTGVSHWRKYLQHKQTLLNSVYIKGDFVLHFAGMDNKLKLIKKYKQQAI